MKVHTKAIHFNADQKLLEFIDKKVGKLETFFDKILDADVTLSVEDNGQVKDKIAKIVLNIPGNQMFASKTGKSFEGSVDEAVESLRRQLKKHKEKLQQKV